MDDRKPVAWLAEFVQHHFLWFVAGSYGVAAFFPAFGRWIREVSFGTLTLGHERLPLTLPSVLLAVLLLNAGLGVQTSQLRTLFHRPLVLVAGLLANLAIPITFILGVTLLMRWWHNPDEVQNILVGLALVASMPIAGSSVAWSQNANGNLALSLGLVLASTFLSPLTTPMALHAVGLLACGDYAGHLHELAASGTGGFLAVAVLLPSLVGILLHGAVGETRVQAVKPLLKLGNAANLLLLNYSNASLSLPEMVADPDWDFLAVVLGIVVSLCVLSFATGWWVGRLVRAEEHQRTSLMFGLGMNNNGTGLVLASLALADHPRVLLPILFYNLVQHLVAGMVDLVLPRMGTARPHRC
jgi:BASS family bile acid:Na+ symporter